MRIVSFDKDRHYNDMCSWWEKHHWIPCPIDALPSVGLVAENDEGVAVAYLGMYVDTVGFVDWAIADTDNPERTEALSTLFDVLSQLARLKGIKYIYSFTKNGNWGNTLKSYGMSIAEQGASSYIMSLDNNDTAFISD